MRRDLDKFEHTAMGFMFAMLASGSNAPPSALAEKSFQYARAFAEERDKQEEFKQEDIGLLYCNCTAPVPKENEPDLCSICEKKVIQFP